MSQRSPRKDHLLTRLEILQQNLDELVTLAKTSTVTQEIQNPTTEIFDLTEELFFELDLAGNISNINKATVTLLGYQNEELLGLNFVDFIPLIEKKKCREFLNKLNLGFPSVNFHTSLISKTEDCTTVFFNALKRGELIYLVGKLSLASKAPKMDKGQENLRSILADRLNSEGIMASSAIPTPAAFNNLTAPFSPSFSGNPAIMSTVDINGFIIEVNELWLNMLGYTREEVLGREALQFFDLTTRKHIADEFIPEVATTGSSKSEKCFMLGKHGQKVEVSLLGSLGYSSIQRVFKWMIFPNHISEETKATPSEDNPKTENFLNADNHLKALINSSKQILFLIDKKMDIIAFNKHAEAIVMKHADKQLKVGHNILNFLEENDAIGLKKIYSEVLHGRTVHFTREMSLPNKNKRWYEVNLFPVEDELVHVNNAVFCAEDITERKLAEEKLKELEINFKSIFTHVAVGVILSNLDNEVLQANKRFYDLIEYSEEEFEDIQLIGVTHPEDREKSIKHSEDLIKGKADHYSLEKRYVTKSGRIVWVYLTATLVRTQHGKPKHIISVAQDITLRKTAEQELLYKKSELDTFVYRASHDLRGPVASLMGLYNIVRVEFAHDKNAITYFEHYNNSVMRLHTVLQNLIDLTKIKESETKLTQVDIRDLIDSCMNTMKTLPDYSRISFDIEVAIDFKVFIDSKKFKTIIKNLVENSIIYATPESTAFVKVIVTYQENVLKIEVSDNGRGIDPRIQSKVFNMFFRGTEKSKGSGLGLYIVKNAVEKLNGSIQLSSKLNEGTKFSVYIPYLYGQEYSALLEKNFVN